MVWTFKYNLNGDGDLNFYPSSCYKIPTGLLFYTLGRNAEKFYMARQNKQKATNEVKNQRG